MRLQPKLDATTIKTHHMQHDRLIDKYWKQHTEVVALKQEMNAMQNDVVNDTATIKHLRSVIAIQRKGHAVMLGTESELNKQVDTLQNEIEDMKLQSFECKNRTPTEMQRAEFQRLKEVHDASRAPITEDEKQVLLNAVEDFDAAETQQELGAAAIVCHVCSTARNLASLPCCKHVAELCTQCYAIAPLRYCPYCRGSLEKWTDRNAHTSGDQPTMLD